MTQGREFLSELVINRTYAKTLDSGFKETWTDTVERNKEMYLKKFPHLKDSINEAYLYVQDKIVLPSMRSLQFAGKPIELSNVRLFNCSFLHMNTFDSMSELFWLLMNGSGVGYSVQVHHVDSLPKIKDNGLSEWEIPDNKEGWADSVKLLMANPNIKFDYSRIRPKDAPISTGGYASGPESLRITHDRIRSVLLGSMNRQLSTLEVHNICCMIADVVIVGSVRRAALIVLFSAWDTLMAHCKQGEWWSHSPWLARANNSAVIDKYGSRAYIYYDSIIKACRDSNAGEPGIYWTEDVELGTNPCQPSWAPLLTRNGITRMKDIKEGDEVWGGKGWTKVTKKWSTGIKSVYKYHTSNGTFIGTENHRVLQDGKKIQVKDAEAIDSNVGEWRPFQEWDKQDVMNGLVFGDGYFHAATNKFLLCIGKDDGDYHNSEIKDLIKSHSSKTSWYVNCTLSEDLGKTYERTIPDEYYYGTYERKCGFLRGLFSANGSVSSNRVQFKTSSKIQAEQLLDMLASMGMRASYSKSKGKKVLFNNGEYECRDSWSIFLYNSSEEFMDSIGFLQEYKMEKPVRNSKPRYVGSDIKEITYIRDEEVFDITVEDSKHNYWTGGLLVSNCVETSLRHGEFCNLSEINGTVIDSYKDFKDAYRAANLLGCLQSTMTDFPYLRPLWKKNCDKSRLLGISITGWAANWDKLIRYSARASEVDMYRGVTTSNAAIVGINVPERTNCVKPSGTASKVLKTEAGIHAGHGKYYINRVRIEKAHPLAKYLSDNFGSFVEQDKMIESNVIISIPCKGKGILRSEESALELFGRAIEVNKVWTFPGHNKGTNKHNVSCTLSVKDDEWEALTKALWDNNDHYHGISMLPYDGGSYEQAPFEEIDEDTHHRLVEWFPWEKTDLSKVNYSGYKEDVKQELACAGGKCEI